MTVKDAVAERFQELCRQRGVCPNELANLAGVTPSTVYSMLDPARQRVSITTIKKTMRWVGYHFGKVFLLSPL